jgi:RNA polymerase sigma-70 factor, ECF subfamily
MEKLWEVLASLRPEQREVLQLKYMEELSLKEIGQVLGKSEAAVSSLLQRARAAALRAGRDYFLEDAS